MNLRWDFDTNGIVTGLELGSVGLARPARFLREAERLVGGFHLEESQRVGRVQERAGRDSFSTGIAFVRFEAGSGLRVSRTT